MPFYKISKKSQAPLAEETLIRIILSIIVVLVLIFPACTVIRGLFFDPEAKFTKSFDEFVNNINELDVPRDEFSLLLDEDSAIVGFSKEGSSYESILVQNLESIRTKLDILPAVECRLNACICLCSDIDISYGKEVTCQEFYCKETKNDISSSNVIFFNPFLGSGSGKYHYWKNGFLFGRNLGYEYNNLPERTSESNTFLVEKKKIGDKIIINVCNSDIFKTEGENNRLTFFGDKCIVTEFDEAKQFEKIIENKKLPESCETGDFCSINEEKLYQKAIQKYSQFIEKYESGTEVEEASKRVKELEDKLKKLE